MQADRPRVLVIHDDHDRLKSLHTLLAEPGEFEVESKQRLPEEVDDLDSYSLVLANLRPALNALPQLLEKERVNLIVTIPLEGFSSSLEWKIFKLERVKAKVIETPGTDEALLELMRVKVKDAS